MAAMALNSVGIAVLALMAALYHTFNHAMFKGELFLGAGALLYSTGTRNMEKMGGLFRRMPQRPSASSSALLPSRHPALQRLCVRVVYLPVAV